MKVVRKVEPEPEPDFEDDINVEPTDEELNDIELELEEEEKANAESPPVPTQAVLPQNMYNCILMGFDRSGDFTVSFVVANKEDTDADAMGTFLFHLNRGRHSSLIYEKIKEIQVSTGNPFLQKVMDKWIKVVKEEVPVIPADRFAKMGNNQ